MINKNYTKKIYKKPFPYIIFEDFFEKEYFNELIKDFPKIQLFEKTKNNVGRMHHDITSGEKIYDNLIKESDAYKKMHHFVYSKDFISFFLNQFKKDIILNLKKKDLLHNPFNFKIIEKPYEGKKVIDKNSLTDKDKGSVYSRIDIGIGKKNYGVTTGGGGIHVDNPQRLISLLFYCGGYAHIEGGEHRIWEESNSKMKLKNTIIPKPNMMIVSLQTNVSYHDVNPIKEIIGSRNAFYLAISSSKKIWKDVKYSKFNLHYNKNRCKKNFLKKIIDLINV